jgi:RNA polymerase sigma factor (sigma-70 family)
MKPYQTCSRSSSKNKVNDTLQIGEALAKLKVSPKDELAWADLYKRLWPSVVFFLLRRPQRLDVGAAQDIAQDTMVKIVQAAFSERDDQFLTHMSRAPDGLRRWAYKVARNAAIDYVRRTRRLTPLESDFATTLPNTDTFEIEERISERLRGAPAILQSLKKHDRRNSVDILQAMALEDGCEDEQAKYVWIRVFLTDRQGEKRRKAISEFGRRLGLSPNATYQQMLRLRQTLIKIEKQSSKQPLPDGL